MNDQIRNPQAHLMRTIQRETRRNIEKRMEERSKRTGLNIAQQAYRDGVFADRINAAAQLDFVNNGGKFEDFRKVIDDEKVIAATTKRLAKKAGLLNKYGVTFKKN